jgi:integrase
MAKHKLKDRQLSTLPPGPKGKARIYADGGGLYLIVRSNSRSFGFRGTLAGKQLPMMHLGPVAKRSLAWARKECERCNELIEAGKDPRAVKIAKGLQGPPPTVNRLLNEYFETQIEPERGYDTERKRRERIAKAQWYLDQIRDAIGKLPVAEITTDIIVEKVGYDAQRRPVGLKEMSKSNRPSSWELRRHLKRAFAMAVALGWRDGCNPPNPASDDILNAVLPNGYYKAKRREGIDYKDAPRFIAEVKAYKNRGMGMADRPLATVPALLYLVYTGVRTEEVQLARWREIDWDNQLWNVPAEHRKAGYKKGKVRAIPISTSMLKVLKKMKEVYPDTTDDDLIFPGRSRAGGLGRGVILSFIRNSLKWDDPITVHGFRSTLRTWALAQRPPYNETFISAQFDHLGPYDDDDFRRTRPSVAAVHYGDADRPEMTDPTIEGRGGRREMAEAYGLYLDSYKT